MTPQMQETQRHRPDKGEFADCLRACLASLFDIPVGTVPTFSQGMRYAGRENMAVYLGRVREWLAPDRTLIATVLPAPDTARALSMMGTLNPGLRWMMVGGSKASGINHAVCCRGGEIEHDPSSIGGIVGPMWPHRKVFGGLWIGESL